MRSNYEHDISIMLVWDQYHVSMILIRDVLENHHPSKAHRHATMEVKNPPNPLYPVNACSEERFERATSFEVLIQ